MIRKDKQQKTQEKSLALRLKELSMSQQQLLLPLEWIKKPEIKK
jgi:hypothetical protein